MLAGQKLVASDGFEVALFPMPYLYMTQDEGGDFSHAGTYNIDFVGFNGTSVIKNAPLYAPCKLRIRSIATDGSNGLTLDSVDKVHLPNGALDYITFSVGHSNNPPSLTIGHVFEQGELFYTTGTAGYVTGDHVHMCVGQGAGGYLVQRSTGNWDLPNRIHMWDGLFVNDTVIIQGYGHNWQEWQGGSTPLKSWGEERKKSFPFPIAWKHWGYR